jgi:ATP-dependent protease ClpP protease subunit
MSGNRPPQITIAHNAVGRRRDRIFARAEGGAFRADASAGVIEILDEIGFGAVTAKDIKSQLDASGAGNLTVRINSPGGSVFEGLAIYNALVAHAGALDVEIVGIAASIASVIAMAGDNIRVAENAFLMCHDAWSVVVGSAIDMRKEADVLESINESIRGVYASRTGLTPAKLKAMMAAETWLQGQAAVDAGFADSLIKNKTANAAVFDLREHFNNVPGCIASPTGAAQDDRLRLYSRRDLQKLLTSNGLSRGAAEKIARGGYAALVGQDQTEIETLTARVAAAVRELYNNA